MAYDYVVGDRVLFKAYKQSKYGYDPYSGPYTIVEVWNNGTLQVQKGAVTQSINIWNVHPYKE